VQHGVKAVKYIGVADVRRITDEEWAATGVRGQDTTTWNAGNGFTILGDRFTQGAIDYFNDDQGFVLIREESTA
jgi:hypothetical protein